MTVEQDRPQHVVLWSLLKWQAWTGFVSAGSARKSATAQQLKEHIGPCKHYRTEGIRKHFYELSDAGLVSKTTINSRSIGFEITDAGKERLDELGKPKHFDH